MINTFTGRWRFLSNFYPVKIEHKGIIYPSVENFYVAMKIKEDQVINNKFITAPDCHELISKIRNPAEAKKLGKIIKVRKDWDEIKFKIMEWGVNEKFKNPELSKMLIDTGEEELIEGNFWHDVYWGKCNCGRCGNTGENNLGKILMSVREKIKNKPKEQELIVSKK
jgi:ribA/ribD-fused uncharacterized protein